MESYLVRREICGLTTKNYNKVATSFIRADRTADQPFIAFGNHMLGMTGDISIIPSDAKLKEAVLRNNVYKDVPTPRLRHILQNVEYSIRDKFDEATVSIANLEIEHVMPHRWSENWPLPNGKVATHENSFEALIAGKPMDDATKALVDTRARIVNTFGNLTLITGSLNSSYGKAGWTAKKDKLGGSLLALNRMVAKAEKRGEEEIEIRETKIADVVASCWTYPAIQ